MTVQNIDSVTNYEGDGATDTFPFVFRILEPTNVFVLIDQVLQQAGYTVNMNVDQDNTPGGNVVFDVPPASETSIVLYRLINETQEIDYTAYDSFPAETHELGLDKLTLLVQQTSTLINHAIHFELDEDPEFVNTLIPPVADRINRFMYFDTEGKLIMYDAVISQPSVLQISIHPDSQTMMQVNYPTTPEYPELELKFNGPLETVKLNEQGKVPIANMEFIGMRVLGPYAGHDLCPKLGDEGGECIAPDTRNPSQRFPEIADDFIRGDLFTITMGDSGEESGTMELFAAIGATQTTIEIVEQTDAIIYLEEVLATDPPNDPITLEGWYLQKGAVTLGSAAFITYDDTGNEYVLGDNVQIALDATDTALQSLENNYLTQPGPNRQAFPLADANLALASGLYHLGSSALNTPNSGQAYMMMNWYQSADRIMQHCHSVSSPNSMYLRSWEQGVWAPWVRLTHNTEFDALAGRVGANETNISSNTGQISTNTGNIATNTANILTNTNAIATKKNEQDFLRTGDRLDINNVRTS